MSETAEKSLYDFLKDQAPNGVLLKQADIHDSEYQRFSKDKALGVRIGTSFGTPGPDAGGVKEWDVCLLLICYARVPGGVTAPDRADPREQATQLAHEVCGLLYEDSSLGGRVCVIQPKRIMRDWDKADKAQTFAVVNIPVVIDPSGRPLPTPFN